MYLKVPACEMVCEFMEMEQSLNACGGYLPNPHYSEPGLSMAVTGNIPRRKV